MSILSSARISPTALYTGEVWQRSNRSFPELKLTQGAMLYNLLEPFMIASRLFKGPTLTDFLLARHDLIDAQVDAHILQHANPTIIEIAAGMSPRGMRFIRRHGPKITYIEADLPIMAKGKRKRIQQHLQQNPNHFVVPVDAFATSGEHSLPALFAGIPAGQPVCVVTEGLLNYFSRQQVEQLFAKLASEFVSRPGSVYVSDIHLQNQNKGMMAETFTTLLGLFVQGRVHLHYQQADDLINALQCNGLQGKLFKPSQFAAQFESCRPDGADFASILVAQKN